MGEGKGYQVINGGEEQGYQVTMVRDQVSNYTNEGFSRNARRGFPRWFYYGTFYEILTTLYLYINGIVSAKRDLTHVFSRFQNFATLEV